MAFHLEGPWLSTTGKKKGKKKFRNADEARRHREAQAEWGRLQKQWELESKQLNIKKAQKTAVYKPAEPYRRNEGDVKIKSLEATWEPCTKSPEKVYTGSAIIGIGTLHKSNAVPIFSNEEARDISKMRR